jgi:hypothetical protein
MGPNKIAPSPPLQQPNPLLVELTSETAVTFSEPHFGQTILYLHNFFT